MFRRCCRWGILVFFSPDSTQISGSWWNGARVWGGGGKTEIPGEVYVHVSLDEKGNVFLLLGVILRARVLGLFCMCLYVA